MRTVLLAGLPTGATAGALRAVAEARARVRVPNTSVYCTEAGAVGAAIEADTENEAVALVRALDGRPWRGHVLTAWLDTAFQCGRVLCPVPPPRQPSPSPLPLSPQEQQQQRSSMGVEQVGGEMNNSVMNNDDLEMEDALPTSHDVVQTGSFLSAAFGATAADDQEPPKEEEKEKNEENAFPEKEQKEQQQQPEPGLAQGVVQGRRLVCVKRDPMLAVCRLDASDAQGLDTAAVRAHFAAHGASAVHALFGWLLVAFPHRRARDAALCDPALRTLGARPLVVRPFRREPEFVLARIASALVFHALRETVRADARRELVDAALFDLLHIAPPPPPVPLARPSRPDVPAVTAPGHLFDDLPEISGEDSEEESEMESEIEEETTRTVSKRPTRRPAQRRPRLRRHISRFSDYEEEDDEEDEDEDYMDDDDNSEESENESEIESEIEREAKRARTTTTSESEKKHKKRKHKHKHKHRHKHKHHRHQRHGSSSSEDGSASPPQAAISSSSDDDDDTGLSDADDADVLRILSSLSSAGPVPARVLLTGFDAEDNEFLVEAWHELQQQQGDALPTLEELYGALPTISPFVGNVAPSGCARTEPYARGTQRLLVEHCTSRFSTNSSAATATLAAAASIPGTPAALAAAAAAASAAASASTTTPTTTSTADQQATINSTTTDSSSNNNSNTNSTSNSNSGNAVPGTGTGDTGAQGTLGRRRAATATADAGALDESAARTKRVVFERSRIHGWGLFALEPIAANDFIVEYVGELIRNPVADAREQRYTEGGEDSSYMFRLDELLVVDATRKGNCARFMNHCCEPNAYARTRVIRGQKRIVIYSLREIAPREEITFDYKFSAEDDDHKLPCFCGAPNCRGFLN